jgi:protein-export membrane protein SecD
VVVVLAFGAAIAVVAARPVRLGLDLRGGTQVVLEAKDSPTRTADSDAVDRALEVLRRRVDQLGVSEPTLQRSGERRIIVELPGVVDPDEAVRVVGQTAQLNFHPVLGVSQRVSSSPSPTAGGERRLILPDESGTRLELGRARLTGEVVQDAQAILDTQQLPSQWMVNVTFAGEGANEWEELTSEAACHLLADPRRRIAIVLDREVISSPEVSPEIQCGVGIPGGTTSITGNITGEDAKDLALLIRAGALPVPVEIVEQRTIGPSLGEAAIRASLVAALVGAALTILYMVAYYRLRGPARAGPARDDDVPRDRGRRRPGTSACVVRPSRRPADRPPSSGPRQTSARSTRDHRAKRGGTIACTRLPSDSRASTHGDDPSTRRPSGATMRSITCRTDSSPSNSRSSTLSIRRFETAISTLQTPTDPSAP